MDAQVWTVISAVATGLLVPIMGALGVWGAAQVKRMQAKTDLKTRKQNAIDATQAVDQLYPMESPDVKKKLALDWAKHLNKVAGIDDSDDTTQIILNESHVLTLPSVQPVVNSSAPTSTTLDNSLPPKGLG
jgi:hypothetical protein